MWHRSQGIETMRKIASWISRAPFPYSPQGDETIRYILYGVSRTFSSYCRILDSKGPFSSWIQLCRVYVSKSCPLNFSPPFFFLLQIFHGAINNILNSVGASIVFIMTITVTTVTKKKKKKEVRRNTHTFRIIRHSQTCKQRRNTCCCKFPCEFPQRELTRLFSYVMSPVWTFDTTVWFR